jgi:hypothetical protein
MGKGKRGKRENEEKEKRGKGKNGEKEKRGKGKTKKGKGAEGSKAGSIERAPFPFFPFNDGGDSQGWNDVTIRGRSDDGPVR